MALAYVYRSLHLYRVQYAIYAIVPQSPRLNRDAKDTDKLIRLKMVCLHVSLTCSRRIISHQLVS